MLKDDHHSGNRTVDGTNADRAFVPAPCPATSTNREDALSNIGTGPAAAPDDLDDSPCTEWDAEDRVSLTDKGREFIARARPPRDLRFRVFRLTVPSPLLGGRDLGVMNLAALAELVAANPGARFVLQLEARQ